MNRITLLPDNVSAALEATSNAPASCAWAHGHLEMQRIIEIKVALIIAS